MMDEVTPKMRTICDKCDEISYTVREKVDEVGGDSWAGEPDGVGDERRRRKAQVAHVDRMVSDAL